jgi:hypothetical protein
MFPSRVDERIGLLAAVENTLSMPIYSENFVIELPIQTRSAFLPHAPIQQIHDCENESIAKIVGEDRIQQTLGPIECCAVVDSHPKHPNLLSPIELWVTQVDMG